jgi:hydrogenase maturation factor HypF (carbamoyltransferase family)
MHNRRLARLLRAGLEAEGLKCFSIDRSALGDGGLSYGQVVIGAATLQSQQRAD